MVLRNQQAENASGKTDIYMSFNSIYYNLSCKIYSILDKTQERRI